MRWGRLLLTFVFLAGFGLFALRASAPAHAADFTINITDTGFQPPSITITTDDEVRWHNVGTQDHNVDFGDGSPLGPIAPDGYSDYVSFDADPDPYTYSCTLNCTNVSGSITVTEAPTTTTTSTTSLSGFTTTTAASAAPVTTVTTRHTTTTARHTTTTRKATTTTSTAPTSTTTTELVTTTSFANFTTSSSTPQLAIKESSSHRDNTPLIIGVVVAIAALALGGFYAAYRFRGGGDGLWR